MSRTNTELNREIRHEIESIIESMDSQFDPAIYADVMLDPTNSDLDQIEANFRRNYSSPSLGIIDGDELSGDELADVLVKAIGQRDFVRLLAAHSDYENSDYYVKWNEMDSCQVGEFEYQIDVADHTALAELISQATDEDWPAKDKESFLAYGYPCDRVIARLDAESFLQDSTVQAAIARSQLKAVK